LAAFPPDTGSAAISGASREWVNRKELIVVDDSVAPSSLSAYADDERLHRGVVVGIAGPIPSHLRRAPMLRILIADDHEIIRRGLRDLLEQHEGWEVCAEASNGREAIERARSLPPHVAVLDLAMPDLNGFEATRQIKKVLPNTEVLIFSVHEAEDFVRDALEAGALGYLLKSDAALHIIAAIEAVSAHKPYFTSSVSRTMLRTYIAQARARPETVSSINQLTGREREMVQLLAEGHTTRGASAHLGISAKTAETHRTRLMTKLGFRSIAELVRFAIRHKMIEP
jgi:DNA-binding NarL/FixJ family response regulator